MFDYFRNWYHTVVYDYADPRTADYPLLGSPVPMLTIVTVYILFIKKYGREYMKNRPAYNLKTVIQFYNIAQVIISTIIFAVGTYCFMQLEDRSCLHFNSYGKYETAILWSSYGYYLDKILDLLDTVFFVLRKKNHLISTLHLYHHTLMVVGGYLFLHYVPVGEIAILGILNTFVHIFMYYYYYIRISNSNTNDLWWKKHITHLQLVQFSALLIWYLVKLFSSGCSYPKYLLIMALTQTITMIFMFSNYYYHAFIKQKKQK